MRERRGTRELAEPILAQAGLPLELADAVDDDSWDLETRQETDEALSLTGKDVGTPIIHFEPPAGVAFFGPVTGGYRASTRRSSCEITSSGWPASRASPSSSESLREQPQLAAFGIDAHTIGQQEDWHGGSRRQKK